MIPTQQLRHEAGVKCPRLPAVWERFSPPTAIRMSVLGCARATWVGAKTRRPQNFKNSNATKHNVPPVLLV